MGYITNAELESFLGSASYDQLADDDGDGIADQVVVDEAREAAEGETNGYLALRYAVPVDLLAHPAAAPMIRAIVLDLTEYRLRLRRPPVSVDALRRRTAAVDSLMKLADGRLSLPDLAVPEGRPHGAAAEVVGEPRSLSRDELADW